jgi:hypothetical protein
MGSRNLPHLAKNERDMGHPVVHGQDRHLATMSAQADPEGRPLRKSHRLSAKPSYLPFPHSIRGAELVILRN